MFDVRTLNLDDQTIESFRPYAQAVTFGFNEPPITNDRLIELHLDWARKDAHRLRGVWDDHAGMPLSPVSTFASWDGTINAGAGVVPANFISNVTVRPTHKRRGLLRAMMAHDLRAAQERGLALATLTATDAAIYGRFGFGCATRRVGVEIDSGERFALRVPARGRCEYADPSEVVGLRNRLFAEHHRSRRGSHSRPSYYDVLDFDWEKQADDHTLRAVVHLDDDGQADGVALFRIAKDRITVDDLQRCDPNAEVALWDLLCGIELINKVTSHTFDPRSALPWALRDPRVITPKPKADHFWLRILDVAGALAARGFEADGELVLDVSDPLGLTGGRVHLSVRDGRAEVSDTTAPADLRLGIAELGSLYLGLADVRTLAALGLAEGPGVLAAHDLFRVADEPWCSTGF
ncbi:MAG: GNAT family N-acetyltransferase [Propionibacteriaceae bacterium]|nr:GNAT family N-acetyltransferase [Propionibacteriaceae bacterium]